jgi:hypothetical protein
MYLLRLLIRLALVICIIINQASFLSSQTKKVIRPSEKEELKTWNESLNKFPLPQGAVELETVHSFPSKDVYEEGIYLWKPLGMLSLPDRNLVVNDQKASQLLMFDNHGYFKRKIGKKGQGPGEFLNPFCLSAISKTMIVCDNSNMRVQFFNLKGSYIRSFKTFKAYLDIDIGGDELIYAVPMRMHPESKLVDILDKNGRLLSTIGEARFGSVSSNWQWPNMVKISLNDKDELFIAFESYPLVCKYSKNGLLLAEFEIEHKRMKELARTNSDRLNNGTWHKGIFTVINSFHTNLDKFYILHNFPRVEILEYDSNGRFLNVYYFEYKAYNIYFQDFFVNEIEGKKTFYLLKRRPEGEIVIFRPKQNLPI